MAVRGSRHGVSGLVGALARLLVMFGERRQRVFSWCLVALWVIASSLKIKKAFLLRARWGPCCAVGPLRARLFSAQPYCGISPGYAMSFPMMASYAALFGLWSMTQFVLVSAWRVASLCNEHSDWFFVFLCAFRLQQVFTRATGILDDP